MSRAKWSLPQPDSPVMSSVVGAGATFSASASSRREAASTAMNGSRSDIQKLYRERRTPWRPDEDYARDGNGSMETLMGPKPRKPSRNQENFPATLLVRNCNWSPA